MIRMVQLDYEQHAGKEYETEVFSDAYLDIEPQEGGFSLRWIKTPESFIFLLIERSEYGFLH